MTSHRILGLAAAPTDVLLAQFQRSLDALNFDEMKQCVVAANERQDVLQGMNRALTMKSAQVRRAA